MHGVMYVLGVAGSLHLPRPGVQLLLTRAIHKSMHNHMFVHAGVSLGSVNARSWRWCKASLHDTANKPLNAKTWQLLSICTIN